MSKAKQITPLVIGMSKDTNRIEARGIFKEPSVRALYATTEDFIMAAIRTQLEEAKKKVTFH